MIIRDINMTRVWYFEGSVTESPPPFGVGKSWRIWRRICHSRSTALWTHDSLHSSKSFIVRANFLLNSFWNSCCVCWDCLTDSFCWITLCLSSSSCTHGEDLDWGGFEEGFQRLWMTSQVRQSPTNVLVWGRIHRTWNWVTHYVSCLYIEFKCFLRTNITRT